MSTEPGRVESDSNAVFAANVSKFESGVAHTSETLADAVSCEAQDLKVKLTGVERKDCVSAGVDGTEKRNGFCDLKRKRESVDVETNGSEIENDCDADAGDVGENRNRAGSGKKGSKLGVVLAVSALLKCKDKNGLKNSNASAIENLKLSDSDLVWAKVSSYPWWPGQVCDASVASKKAKKHFKKGNFLVAYFGDSSFAWNDASRIKPFHQHFSQMQKQSDSVEFCNAIDCALEEVARRVEFGLYCPCISEEAYNKLKTQKIVNPGIREDSRVRYGGDNLSNAISFKPAKLVEYVKHLAYFPSYDATERLRFVTNQAQLLAFQQWKGYSHFPEYERFLWSVEFAVPEASFLELNTDEEMFSKRRKTDYKDTDEHRQKFDSEDRTDEKTKEKSLSDSIAKKRFGSRSIEKLAGKSHSDKKLKVESSESGKSEKKIKNNRQTEVSVSQNSDEENYLSVGDAKKLQKAAEPCFGTGAVPLRMESEMNSLTLTPTPCSDSNSITKVEVENKNSEKPKQEELAQRKISSPYEMLIPESISIDLLKEISSSNLSDESKKASITETSEPRDVKDSSEEQILPDEMLSSLPNAKTQKEMIPKSISMNHSNYEDFDKFLKETYCSNLKDESKKASLTETSEPSDAKDTSPQQILPANKDITGSGLEEQTGLKDCCADSSAPNALILNFADSGSVPSEEKLNEIFNRYGPLKESETKVMKNGKRTKVVFKRGEDAKTAFSSAGKYSIFGPSPLSYRLMFAPNTK